MDRVHICSDSSVCSDGFLCQHLSNGAELNSDTESETGRQSLGGSRKACTYEEPAQEGRQL